MGKKGRKQHGHGHEHKHDKHKRVERVCRTCRYFDLSFIVGPEDRESWCHRYPPNYVGPTIDVTSLAVAPNDGVLWEHPTVGICHWCGEWKKRQDVEWA